MPGLDSQKESQKGHKGPGMRIIINLSVNPCGRLRISSFNRRSEANDTSSQGTNRHIA